MDKSLRVEVQTFPLKLSREHMDSLSRADSYDWILFTSKHAVEYFFRIVDEQKIRPPERVRIAAVGPVTARALRDRKFKVAATPAKATAKDMVEALGIIKGKRLLFPRSAVAPMGIIRDMRKHGASVSVIPLYTTKVVPLSKRETGLLKSGQYASIVFKSPSGVIGFLEELSVDERKRAFALRAECIGATTAKAARAAGFRKVKDLSI